MKFSTLIHRSTWALDEPQRKLVATATDQMLIVVVDMSSEKTLSDVGCDLC